MTDYQKCTDADLKSQQKEIRAELKKRKRTKEKENQINRTLYS